MANTASRLSANGSLTISGYFNEILKPFVTSGLIAYWDTEKGYSNSKSTWVDLTDNNTVITFSNPNFTSNTGNITFTRPNLNYGRTNLPQLAGATAITVEGVMSILDFVAAMPFGFGGYDVYTNGGYLGFNTAASDVYGISPATVVSLGLAGKYIHYAFVMAGPGINIPATNQIWINGVQQSLSQQLGTTTTSPGFNADNNNFAFALNGWTRNDNVYFENITYTSLRIYNRALTPNEIKQNYNLVAPKWVLTPISGVTNSDVTSLRANTLFAREFDEVTYNQNNSAPNKNVFNWSQDFSRGGWSNYNLTVTQNADIAPDGTRTATLLTGGGLYNNIRYNNGYVFVGGGGFREGETWTHSLFVKYGTQNQVTLVAEDWNFTAINGINYNWITTFNLLTGAVTGGGITIVNQGMTNVGNGWWRIWISFRVPAVVGFTPQSLQFRPGLYDGTDYTGKLTYVWGAQLERGASPTEYVGTSSPKNFLLFSEEYGRDNSNNFRWYIENISVSKATIPDPNGNFNASLISSTINGSINTCYVSQQVFDVVPNVNYTYSVYLKQGTSPTSLINFYSASPFYQLTATITWPTIAGNAPTVSYAGGPVTTAVTPAPNGWYRFSMSLTNNASTSMVCRVYVRSQGVNNVIGDTVYVWGAQMEFGLAPTNYIPNGALYSATLPLAPAAMKTINTGNTFIKGTYDEYSKMSPITEGLIFNVDPGYEGSYVGSGATMYDTTQNRYRVDLNNSPPYSSDFGGTLKFTSTFGNNAWANTNFPARTITPTSNYTMSAWIKLNRSNSGLAEFQFYTPSTGALVSPQANTGFSYGSIGCILGTNYYGDYGLFWSARIQNSGAKELLMGFQNRVTPYQEASPQLTYPMNNSLIFFNWTHIVGVLNNAGNFAGFYVNGVLATSTTASQIASGSFPYTIPTIRICADNASGGSGFPRNFDGDIGPMSIWNRALSASEIQQMYSSQRSRFGV